MFFRNYFLFFKSEFWVAKKYTFKLFSFLAAVFLFVCIFSPILKNNIANYSWEQKLINKSGKYDYRIELPDHRTWSKIRDHQTQKHDSFKDSINYFFKTNPVENEAGNWDFLFTSSVYFNDIEKGFFYKILTVPLKEKNLNKVVNILNQNSDKNLGTDLIIGQAIVSNGFLRANDQYFVGGDITIFDEKLKIIAAGENLSSHSFESVDLGNIILSSKFKAVPYQKGAFVHVSETQFKNWRTAKKFFDNKNFLFIREKQNLIRSADPNKLFSELRDYINQPIKNVAFGNELSSGFKMRLTRINLISSLVIFVFVALIIIFIFVFFSQSEIKYKKNIYRHLFANGVSLKNICLIQGIRNFIFFAIFFTCAYFLGILVGYQWILQNWLNSANKVIDPQYFSTFSIIATAIIVPLFYSIIIYFYVYRFAVNQMLLSKNQIDSSIFIDKRSKLVTFLFFNWLAIRFQRSRKYIITFWSFKRPSKQIFFIFIEISIMIVIFFSVFVKVSFNNYIGSSIKFLSSSAQSVTEIKNSLSLTEDGKQLQSLIMFVTTKKTDNFAEITDRTDLTTKIIGGILGSRNFVQTQTNRNFKITKNIKIPEIKRYMEEFDLNEIYFGVAPYDKELDLPATNLNFEYPNLQKKGFLKTAFAKNDDTIAPPLNTSRILFIDDLFMPGKITKFLSIENNFVERLSDQMKNFQIENGDVYVTEQFVTSYGYKLGDKISGNLKLDQKKIKNEKEFRIVGVINSKIYINPLMFADYKYIKNNLVSDSAATYYNIIISTSHLRHFNRFLVIDLYETTKRLKNLSLSDFDGNFVTKLVRYLSIANVKSLFLHKVDDIFVFHFGNYQNSLTYLMFLLIFILAVSIFISAYFLFESEKIPFNNLRVLGYHWHELIKVIIVFGMIRLFYVILIALGVNFLLFGFVNYWIKDFSSVSLNIDNIHQSLIYLVLSYVILILFILFVQWIVLKKQKLFTYKMNKDY